MRRLRHITLIVLACFLLALLLCTRPVFGYVNALSDIPDWLVSGEEIGSELGYSVDSAGDVNGDGYDDVLIGVPRYDDGVYREGAAFVYHGSAEGLALEPDWVAGSTQTAARFGNSVSSAGDVNDDGYDDMIVGAYRYNNGEPEEGAVFLYLGSESGLAITHTWSIESDQSGAMLGFAVGDAGDVNGDGFGDVIVGARWYSNEETNEGAAFVFYGSDEGLNTTPDWTLEGNQPSASLGYAVTGAGDLNGDGYDDVAVGGVNFENGEEDEGVAYVFYGSKDGLGDKPDWSAEGNLKDAYFGVSVGIIGDVDADGDDELVVGAMGYSGEVEYEGAAFVYYGSPGGLEADPHLVIYGEQSNSGFGKAVGSGGDVNGDGYEDLLVGAYNYTDDQNLEGGVFAFFGGPLGLNGTPAWSAFGNKAETEFGFAAATAGDINGDGCSDIIVGAPGYRLNRIIVGRAFEFNGVLGEMHLMYLSLVQ
jgi:hypothetical protein